MKEQRDEYAENVQNEPHGKMYLKKTKSAGASSPLNGIGKHGRSC